MYYIIYVRPYTYNDRRAIFTLKGYIRRAFVCDVFFDGCLLGLLDGLIAQVRNGISSQAFAKHTYVCTLFVQEFTPVYQLTV